MDGMRIEAGMVAREGYVTPLATQLMELAIAFFEDPENEREYQEWKKAREARKGA